MEDLEELRNEMSVLSYIVKGNGSKGLVQKIADLETVQHNRVENCIGKKDLELYKVEVVKMLDTVKKEIISETVKSVFAEMKGNNSELKDTIRTIIPMLAIITTVILFILK